MGTLAEGTEKVQGQWRGINVSEDHTGGNVFSILDYCVTCDFW